jgi:MSHA biogenesis protein MshE
MLRQDPDIVLVGEMRDGETVSIGLRTAMTGHFVLSTLHTNDAISTTMRLVDMGAEPYLIAGALRGVLSQRLVRRICENCAAPETLDANTQILLGHELGGLAADITFMRGQGCTYCNDTGYHGRIGIYELLEINGELAEALHNNDLLGFAKLAVQQPGYQSLRHSAVQLAAQGLTTVDEVVRVSFGMED